MAGPSSLAITEVRAWACRFPLPAPFRLGRATLGSREYVVVRVRTAGGLEGAAFSLARRAPLDVIVTEMTAPPVLGRDAAQIDALHAAWRTALPHHAPEGLVLRAESLLDIAAWDLVGRAAGEPVWRMLGGARDSAPVMLVEGYAVTGEDDEAFSERIRAAAADGFSAIKLANLADDSDAMTRRLECVRDAVGHDVALTVDIGFGWPEQDVAVRTARRWEPIALAWIEDPLHGHDVDRLVRLRTEIETPIAVGDEVTSRPTAAALVQAGAVDVLRGDATCVGGITGLLEVQRAALARGVGFSTHIYPEIHRHVALANADGGYVEAFRPDTPFDTPQAFSAPPPTVVDPGTGVRVLRAPDEPGLGLTIDWEAVERHSVRSSAAQLNP